MFVQDYDFKPQYSKASVERGIKFLEETQKGLKDGLLANQNGMYCIHGTSEDVNKKVLNGACHRQIDFGLGDSMRRGTKPVDLVSTLTHRLDQYSYYRGVPLDSDSYNVNPEITEEFTRFLTQESLYARFFVPMPLEFSRDYGLLISTDIPAPLLQNMCILSRHTREKPSALRRWMGYVQKGIPKDIAFVIATNTTVNSAVAFPQGNLHFTLPSGLSLRDAALRAILGDFRGLSDEDVTYRHRSNYTGGSAYLTSTNKQVTDCSEHWMLSLNKTLQNKGKVVSLIPNPFKKPVSNDGTVPVAKFENEIVPMFVEEVSAIIKEHSSKESSVNLSEKAA